MKVPLSVRRLDELTGNQPFVPASVVIQVIPWSAGTLRNRATSTDNPLPFPSIKFGGKRVYQVEGLRSYLLSIDQPQHPPVKSLPIDKPKPEVRENPAELRSVLGQKFAVGRRALREKRT
jgi:hypothetical protein